MSEAEQRNAESREVGQRLRELRLGHRLSMRQLSKQAGVALSYLAGVEAGRTSPTIATLRKLLTALGTDLGAFFTEPASSEGEIVIRQEEMRVVVDPNRRYVFVLPRRPDIQAEIVDETILPGETPEFETLSSDMAGYVLQGELLLEIQGEERQWLRPQDAFYLSTGRPVRGSCAKPGLPVRLLTIYVPARY